jgi:hypothetical protein
MVEGCECGGSGILEKDGKLYECVCALLRRRAASMPPFIRTADLRKEHASHKLHDQIRKSMFILASWPDMKAIIKAVMIRHLNLFVRVTSDNEILHAYVGAMSKKNRGDSEATFETVSDFVGSPGLVIVRLNAITRPNKAAAGALEEAVVCRMDQDKPTWLVSDMDRPFTSASPAYSESLWDLMEAFVKIKISPILPKSVQPSIFDPEIIISGNVDDSTKPAQDPKKYRPKPTKRKTEDSEDIDEDTSSDGSLSMYGQGIKQTKSRRDK